MEELLEFSGPVLIVPADSDSDECQLVNLEHFRRIQIKKTGIKKIE